MTFLKETKKYSIQSIILEPYGREFKVQHWISDMSISSKKMPSGEILNAEIFSARQSGNF